MRSWTIAASLYVLLALTQAATAATPMQHVLVTLPPLMPLVEEVMRGTGAPEALTRSGDAHTMLISPSMAKKIAEAKVVIIPDRGMHPGLMKRLSTRSNKELTIIALTELEGADPLSYRATNQFTDHAAHDGHEEHAHHHDEKGGIDPHLWLDPLRMSRVVRALAERFAELDPARGETYRVNADRIAEHLATRVHPAIADMFALATPSQEKDVVAIVTYHDAYRYFSTRYGLEKLGYVTQRPEEYIGAASMKALMDASKTRRVRCLIAESASPLAKRIALRTEATIVPLNAEILYAAKETPDAAWATNEYDRLLAKIAKTFVGCIEGTRD